MNRINYKIADATLLVIAFSLILILNNYFSKVKSNNEDFILCILVSMIFIMIYIGKLLFIPSYKEVLELKNKGWKITGYYSSKSLNNEKAYYSLYDFWAKTNLKILLLELCIFLLVCFINDMNVFTIMEVIHFGCIFLIQILAWIATRKREKVI